MASFFPSQGSVNGPSVRLRRLRSFPVQVPSHTSLTPCVCGIATSIADAHRCADTSRFVVEDDPAVTEFKIRWWG
jgi:hypothetical protein